MTKKPIIFAHAWDNPDKTVTRRLCNWEDILEKTSEDIKYIERLKKKRRYKKGQKWNVVQRKDGPMVGKIKIMSVRIERLTDIDQNEVLLEGFKNMSDSEFIKGFRSIYEHYGQLPESKNIWVYRIEFKRIKGMVQTELVV